MIKRKPRRVNVGCILMAVISAIALIFVIGALLAPAHGRDLHRYHYHRAIVHGGDVVSHPSGCPRVAFCGCGAAVRVFGSPVRSLWLAANWFRFPRAMPGPGMVAVRRHHVFVLEADLGRGIWRVYDANSGGHLTRVHARPIAGYAIVNPRGI